MGDDASEIVISHSTKELAPKKASTLGATLVGMAQIFGCRGMDIYDR